MDLALLFDVDGTLTPPRSDLEERMADALVSLTVPFHVAAGSNIELVDHQFLEPLWRFGFRGTFDAFLSNGAARYHCDFSERCDARLVESFDFASHLGAADYEELVSVLRETLTRGEFALPPSQKVVGDQIVNRTAMLNFAPPGRPEGRLSPEAQEARKQFIEFDRSTGYRARVLEHLKQRLGGLIETKKLGIMLGGQTSFDLVIEGQDKTNAVRTLLKEKVKHLVFVGDALFPGGNDSPIADFVASWRGPGPCPVEAVPVEGVDDTLRLLRTRGWSVDRSEE